MERQAEVKRRPAPKIQRRRSTRVRLPALRAVARRGDEMFPFWRNLQHRKAGIPMPCHEVQRAATSADTYPRSEWLTSTPHHLPPRVWPDARRWPSARKKSRASPIESRHAKLDFDVAKVPVARNPIARNDPRRTRPSRDAFGRTLRALLQIAVTLDLISPILRATVCCKPSRLWHEYRYIHVINRS